ncbi:hypothetical protein FSPOR_4272 [Fusarium sporotrichioides]|uniref:Uncharacterized protein n=1 Tax=Fusarium sporotrichioides TaxID=5514 RepID=A0A395SD46_FUSSP|nr:hypothetical protein FSPOR_4272 [Fusarium sporotrichioides]
MPKRVPSTKTRPAPVRRPSTGSHGPPPPPPPSNPGPLRPPLNSTSSGQRARSHETESRRPRYPPVSGSPRHSYYDRPAPPKRRDSRWRSVSPHSRAPPPPPPPPERVLRRRVTRDSDWMSEDESRPTSRRRTPSPNRRQRQDYRPQGQETPPWPSSPKPAGARPAVRSYPTDSSRPDPRRLHSYEAPPSPKRPPIAGKRSPPSGYRPAPHLAAEMLRGRPRSRTNSPLSNQETHRPPNPERRPSHNNGAQRRSPRTQPAKPTKQNGPEQATKPEAQKKGFDFMKHLPQAFATYAGIEALSEHADTAKDWADWFMNLRKTPEEIHELSAKATTARDTITQIQNTLEARPDIIDGDDARPMRRQIDDSIRNATAALDKMTKLLQEISSDGLEGTKFASLEEFYNSYKYKDEWEEKIKLADADLEKELAALSKLMVNIYSRALMKPPPPGFENPVPPPAPGQTSDSPDARRPSATSRGSRSRVTSPILEPPPVGRYRKSIDVDDDEPTHNETTNGVKNGVTPDTEVKEQPEVPNQEGEKAVDGENANAQDTADTETRDIKLKVDDDPPKPDNDPADVLPAAAKQPEISKEQDLPKKEKPAGIKPAQPTPIAVPPSKHSPPAKTPEDTLLDAAWNGDIQACSEALRQTSPSTRDTYGLTPLHLAAERDHLAIAMLLRDSGASASVRTKDGRTPLHLASRYGSSAIVEFLLDGAHADPNAKTTDGRTPLHYAASSAADGDEEKREVVRLLRDYKADPTAKDAKGRTARDVAQKRDYWDVSATLRRAEKKWEEEHHQNWFQRHGLKR